MADLGDTPPTRMLDLDETAAELGVSRAQVYALVRRGDLAALKLGGRGMWRVDRADLEGYIAKAKKATVAWIQDHPYEASDIDDEDDE